MRNYSKQPLTMILEQACPGSQNAGYLETPSPGREVRMTWYSAKFARK